MFRLTHCAARGYKEVAALLATKGRILQTWEIGRLRIHWVRLTPDICTASNVYAIEQVALRKLMRSTELRNRLDDIPA